MSALKQYDSNIIRIRTVFVNNYLIQNGNRSVLVDTGIETSGQMILQALQSLGMQPQDIRLIILTHTHYDHCRGAAEIKAVTGAELLVHKSHEIHLRKGTCRLPRGTNVLLDAWVTMGRTVMPWLSRFHPVEPDIVITDDHDLQYLGLNARIIHTPGHTDGSLSVILDGRYAMVGDTVIGGRGKSVFPPFADEPAALIRTWKMLIDDGVHYCYPGHGHPIPIQRMIGEYDELAKRHGR